MTVRAHPARLLKKAGQQFDYPVVLIGTTPDGLVTVYSGQYQPANPTAQAQVDVMAQAMLSAAPKAYADCAAFFGMPGSPVNLIVADIGGGGTGDGGAYHYSCDFTTGGDLYIDAAFGNTPMDVGLFIAELSECFMGAAGKGWNCGGSGGEALSRALAEIESGGPNGALAGFASAPTWDQSGRPDWLDSDEGTDQDYISIGCGMVYLSWMMAMGFSPAQIAQAGEPSGTLASNYQALTQKTTAWADMTAALAALGQPIANDDPFGGIANNSTTQPAPGPSPVPIPTPQPPPTPSPSPNPSVNKTQAIAALTALVNASTLPD